MAITTALRKSRAHTSDTISALKALLGDRLSTSPSVLSTPDQIGVVAIVAQVPRVPWALAGDQP